MESMFASRVAIANLFIRYLQKEKREQMGCLSRSLEMLKLMVLRKEVSYGIKLKIRLKGFDREEEGCAIAWEMLWKI